MLRVFAEPNAIRRKEEERKEENYAHVREGRAEAFEEGLGQTFRHEIPHIH